MDNAEIRGKKGTLHFIRFPTAEMGSFLQLARSKGSECCCDCVLRCCSKLTISILFFLVAKLLTTVCATGGGAFKFEEQFHKEVNMQLQKFDELDALIKGILFADTHNRTECYYYENASDIR